MKQSSRSELREVQYNMIKVGLTGGIGTGKTFVARIFDSLGAIIIDADEVARFLRQPGNPGYQAILDQFGTTDRTELRRLVSSSSEAKSDLEAILHPLIKLESERRMEEAMRNYPHAPCLIYEATLLIEAGRAEDFDFVVLVTAPLKERLKRIAKRDQISEDDSLKMVEAQNIDSYRIPHSQFIIQNHGSTADLEERVRKVLEQIIST